MLFAEYLHDMRAWEALSTEEQEKAIGRRKFDDRELDENDSDTGGNELKIVRTNMPFANHFRGESAHILSAMPARSALRAKCWRTCLSATRGNPTDCTAVTGTLFFGPSQDLLEELGK